MTRFAMSQITFYHNPHCSKSRAALALLEERGSDIRLIEYLKTPPTMTELEHLATQPGVPVREMIRSNESVYRELKLDNPVHGEADLLRAIAKHPILLQRPIAVTGGHAVIGRPPEKVLEL
jgi:arsenate reductase